jgi:glucose-1-phosphate thymidylyltransferase
MDLRGVILAGGKGSRLGELTKVTNKHLLPVGPYPMVYHPLKKLVGAGIRDILLVSGTEHMGDFVELLGSGREHGCRLTYRVQDEAGGIAQALGLAALFCRDARSVVLLGDNIFHDPLAPLLQASAQRPTHAWIALKQVPDPSRYGVAELDGETIRSIE